MQSGAERLRSWGLRVRLGPQALGASDGLRYLSAADRTRAREFSDAWTDPDTAVVWAARGGYGAQRMVDLLDLDRLRSAGPKHFVGFSDITALHSRIGRELGQVTLHGPGVGSLTQLEDAPSAEQLRALLMEPPTPGAVLCSGSSVVTGKATGLLAGGNLSLLAADVGIEPAPSAPTIAVFEDVGEQGYRVDRMLTQLLRSGWFASVVGVVVGDFTSSLDESLVDRVVADRLGGLGVPVVRVAGVGHGPRNLTLPLGAAVRLVAAPDGGTLSLVE